MTDIANLGLNVQGNAAVSQLNKVEQQLTNTAKASKGLVDSLKQIGLTLGLGKLIKESLRLDNDLRSVQARFKAIFGSTNISGLNELSNQFNLTRMSAMSVLTTLGKYSTALGNTSAQTAKFASEIGMAAAAIGSAFSIDNVNEVAEKLGAATLGRTRGLQEYGIAIDTTSASFKKLVDEIQATTGATEAQAKQMAIAKEIMEQTKRIAGEAGNDIFDAWNQLNKLWNNIKEVMSIIGKILSVTVGPVVAGINAILNTGIG